MTRACILALVIASAVAGCEGESHSSRTGTTTTGSPGAGTSTTASASRSDCKTLGIDPSGMREGICTHDGITWTIVDEDHTLKLSTLWAKLAGVSTSKTRNAGKGRATVNEQSVAASITITNKLPAPQTFDGAHTQQAGLILEGAVFKEAVAAEQADPTSCLRDNRTPLQPGKSATCAVVFEVPPNVAADLGKHGSGDLYLVNFGSDLSGSTFPETIGQIRLYH